VEQLGLVERQPFTPPELENARVTNGELIIEARKESREGIHYSSACLISQATWRYGRVDVRAKLPTGRGIWPAIWMIPPNGEITGWPDCGEIDLVEHFGANRGLVFVNVNTKSANIAQGTAAGKWLQLPDLADAFHLYSLEWRAEQVVLFVGERKVLLYEKASDDTAQWPFDKPFEIRLQLNVGGVAGIGTDVDDSLFPQRLAIDFVRVYQKQ
jgi:beta-glucanase (GH16 family)